MYAFPRDTLCSVCICHIIFSDSKSSTIHIQHLDIGCSVDPRSVLDSLGPQINQPVPLSLFTLCLQVHCTRSMVYWQTPIIIMTTCPPPPHPLLSTLVASHCSLYHIEMLQCMSNGLLAICDVKLRGETIYVLSVIIWSGCNIVMSVGLALKIARYTLIWSVCE